MLVLLPLVVKRPVKVVGTAVLEPAAARTAYAQRDGVVQWVLDLPADRMVQKGQVLASLDTRSIDSEIDRVTSEIGETEIGYRDAVKRRGLDSPMAKGLAAKLQVKRAELAKLQVDLEEYQIRAPVAGKVTTPEQSLRLLTARPVKRGEAVMEVVPTDTSWELTVQVPEDEAGDLLRAYDDPERQGPLKAWVILKARPRAKLVTEVLSLAPRARVVQTGERKYRNVIEVRVAEPKGLRQQIDPREGMEGKVAITCGRRSLWYNVTHEFTDFMRVSLF